MSPFYDILGKEKLQGQKREQWSPGAEVEGRDSEGHGKTFMVKEMYYILVVVVVTQLYSLVKTKQTVYLKTVNFSILVCKLNFTKPDLNRT